ncbi:MAG: RagB/SusD family nutrient uptake outer membrane protein, partial [Bacteroidales bacterium]|nr:RagB/SusD family nutrient uptake outer membrane protein [Bacteroidales bacterium]
NYIYNGNYQGNDDQLGVAGRVGLDDNRGISVDDDVIYEFHPYNNEVIGYQRISTTLEKQFYLEEVILKERARELAFEGERFYDIVRIARRRNKLGEDGGSFLANIIAEKFPASEREHMFQYLQNSENWYLPFVLR